MGIQVALRHLTQYTYEKAVALGPQVIQLRPAPHCRTTIVSYSLDVKPANHILNWQFDPFANQIARVVFPERTGVFAVEVNLVAEMTPINPFAFLLEPGYASYPFRYSPELLRDLEPYRKTEPAGPLLRRFVGGLSRETQSTLSFLSMVNRQVCEEIGYVTRLEHGVQTCDETLSGKTGSCRDSAWLLVQVFRQMGIAARFVSGYLIQMAGEDGVPKEDSADLHAWAEVYLPGAGWLGMDPTSGLFAAEGHIPLVCTPDAGQAAPIGGTVEPAGVEFRDQGSGKATTGR